MGETTTKKKNGTIAKKDKKIERVNWRVGITHLDDYGPSLKHGTYDGDNCIIEGVRFQRDDYLVKYPRIRTLENGEVEYSTSPISEFIGSHIYQFLGIPVQETLLVERKGQIAVACKDFVGENEHLLEYKTIRKSINSDILDALITDHALMNRKLSERQSFSLEEIMLQFNVNPIFRNMPDVKVRFFEQAIVDIFINNNDRNERSWGIIRDAYGSDRLAPVFGNDQSFQTVIDETDVEKLMNSRKAFEEKASTLPTSYCVGGMNLNGERFFEYAQLYQEFQIALTNIVPKIRKNLDKIKDFIEHLPETYTMSNGTKVDIISETRQDFFYQQLEYRFANVLLPAYARLHGEKTAA